MINVTEYNLIKRNNTWLLFTAEIEPAPAGNMRPWKGMMSRWWFEVQSQVSNPATGEVDNEIGTYAYIPGGGGGAFTLRRCWNKAYQAIQDMAEWEETSDERDDSPAS